MTQIGILLSAGHPNDPKKGSPLIGDSVRSAQARIFNSNDPLEALTGFIEKTQIKIKPVRDDVIEFHHDTDGYIGGIEFVVEGNLLEIADLIKRNNDSKYNGIGTALLAAVLAKNPQITEIGGILGEREKGGRKNKDDYKNARARGMSPKDAIKETRAYKMRAQFGFSKVLDFKTEPILYLRTGKN